MIRYLDSTLTAPFLAACELDPVIGGEICTQLAVYGHGARDVDFWLMTGEDGSVTAAICRDFGRVRVSAAEAVSPGELGAFLRTIGWRQVQVRGLLCKELVPVIGGMWRTAPIMRYRGGVFGKDYSRVTASPPLWEVYALNQMDAPPPPRSSRDRWYAFASHLVRHRLGTIAGVMQNGGLICTGGVYGQSASHSVIACLATAPSHQNAGWGSLMVQYLCDEITAGAKTPILVCGSDDLTGYYGRLGFVQAGRWGEITKRGLQ